MELCAAGRSELEASGAERRGSLWGGRAGRLEEEAWKRLGRVLGVLWDRELDCEFGFWGSCGLNCRLAVLVRREGRGELSLFKWDKGP